jgi:hypothetical protein
VDCEHINSDHICLSCGRAMRLARTVPGFGELPELRITTARHVESYLRKAWDGQRGARALAFKIALCSAALRVNPAAWRYSPQSAAPRRA